MIMDSSMVKEVEAWETEGGAVAAAFETDVPRIRGTELNVECPVSVGRHANAGFDPVAASFRSSAARQNGDGSTAAGAAIATPGDGRFVAVSGQRAGCFTHRWQEFTHLVRRMILHDRA